MTTSNPEAVYVVAKPDDYALDQGHTRVVTLGDYGVVNVPATHTFEAPLRWAQTYGAVIEDGEERRRMSEKVTAISASIKTMDAKLSLLASAVEDMVGQVESESEKAELMDSLERFATSAPWSREESFASRVLRIAAFGYEWNGPGTSPLGASALTAAVTIAQVMRNLSDVEPFVAPGNDGSIVLEWDTPDGTEAEVHVMPGEGIRSAVLVLNDEEREFANPSELAEDLKSRFSPQV